MRSGTIVAKKRSRAITCAHEVLITLRREGERLDAVAWPAAKWREDPAGFVRHVLHEEPLPHQVKILEAARDNDNVAVRSGQKCGKTKLVIWLSLWHYCSFEEAEVIMTASNKGQVQNVLWKELRSTLRHAAAHGFKIESPAANPETGLRSSDGRIIRGLTVRDKEAMAGISGRALLFVVDEASHLSTDIAETIEGNTAGGGKRVYISNPTRTEGPFFEIFHNEGMASLWKRFHLSSEDVANWCDANGVVIPGIARASNIQTWAETYGRDNPFYIVRVLGDFLRNETGKIISLDLITNAQRIWQETAAVGILRIGVDPAGEGSGGDEFAFTVVRGQKMLALHTFRGLSEEAAIAHIRSFIASHRSDNEIPEVVLDAEGPIGSALVGRLKGISENLRRSRPNESFEVYGVKASHWARREPLIYERIREELWANAVKWLKNGGALISDAKLETELHAPFWSETIQGKLKCTPKDALRDALGRSPDRADSFLLAVWEPAPWLEERKEEASMVERENVVELYPKSKAGDIDPYDAPGFDGGGYDPYNR